jgi:hypothetical protein
VLPVASEAQISIRFATLFEPGTTAVPSGGAENDASVMFMRVDEPMA